jgi:hypothetical protein
MASYKVILEVVVRDLDEEESERLHDSPFDFLEDGMLLDDAEVVGIREI